MPVGVFAGPVGSHGTVGRSLVHAADRRVAAITLGNMGDLPQPCRSCVSWELDQPAAERVTASGDAALEKEAWISAALLEQRSCGLLAYVRDAPAGFVLYAPPAMVPRATTFPTSPVSGDAALLITAYVEPECRGAGVGRALVQGAARELLHHGIRAIEAFGDAHWEKPACVLPAGYLEFVGFEVIRPHHRWPRLRLELRSAETWREHAEVAVERIVGSVVPEPALRPV